MTAADRELAMGRFSASARIARRQGQHLAYSHSRLGAGPHDAAWVKKLESEPELAERLEAFVSRFGRLQDTIAARLLPRWLECLAETPGSQIEVLDRAERLGVLPSTEGWLAARKLRNRLVHEYMEDAEGFASDIDSARAACAMLFDVYNRVIAFVRDRLGVAADALPAPLAPLGA